ncbi:MAG: class I SAM-dependent methyltransferase [Leptolyngbyaceae cyanobacterium SM1_1_3]|nr:class I SAM-dependent methyltransferase [Leptolyngbyaceae cyanobacterium SM1_1_3]NJN02089.1 class I SAM-dependent methyltransferase [Leptolyngbyaceae cyanobacterium RM1_1_2]NJO09697.1 class I SAM-dependent methyltransferase [Leptolyngbyaceae cyanobacterium SL_1_1]
MSKDYFSDQAADYAQYRPHYPDSLFEYLSTLCAERRLVWDCGTGNGQAAVALTKYFEQVIATDVSAAQLAQALAHSQVSYRLAPAENNGIADHTLDLVVAAQALHWFNQERFYSEVKRSLKPTGIVAVWCYELMQISPTIDRFVQHFYAKIVGPHWPPERQMIEDRYQTITFPFRAIAAPAFQMEATWTFEQMLGYLNTWSATQRFLRRRQIHPVNLIQDDLARAWGDLGDSKQVIWPLYLRLGRPHPRLYTVRLP